MSEWWRKSGTIGFQVWGGTSMNNGFALIRTDVRTLNELQEVIKRNFQHYKVIQVWPNVYMNGEYFYPIGAFHITEDSWTL